MAEPAEPMSGTEAIRSLRDHDAVFKAFDAYPWARDEEFQSGLLAILGDPSSPSPQGSPSDMATHARVFYYARRIGVSVDFAAYQEWLAEHPDHRPPQVVPDEYLSSSHSGAAPPQPQDDTSDASDLAWQQAAPKADLFVNRQQASQATADGTEPNYPMGFAEMLRLLQEGKEIPGIRQIPNTVARAPNVKPVGSRTAPRKPWEKNTSPPASVADNTGTLDANFPPVESEVPSLSPPGPT